MDGWMDGWDGWMGWMGWMNGEMDGWMMDGWMDEWTDGERNGWMDGWKKVWMDGEMDGWTDGKMNEVVSIFSCPHMECLPQFHYLKGHYSITQKIQRHPNLV